MISLKRGVSAHPFELRGSEPGRYLLAGELCFASAEKAFRRVLGIIGGSGETTLDLGGVVRADSAGLALLLEWQRQAELRGSVLHYVNLPQQLRAIAHVAGVEDILG
ncbi:MAG: STAS domain-containing protein [Methylococcaceae bacterium]|nr:STAS domain-containing protein [Methylococcaceae bacterium]